MSEPIFVEQKPNEGAEHQAQAGKTIGREGCDVNISDPEISRRHAAIKLDGGTVAIEDLGSTNGTFVNGERISGARALSDGDEVRFGGTVWRLQAAATAPAPSPSAPPQVTAVGQVQADPPTAPQPPAAAPAPVAPVPVAAAAPPAPTPPVPAGGADKRGDVPRPDFAPSAIRRVVPPPGDTTVFNPAGSRRKGSAATQLEATIFATAVTLATAAGVVIYYIAEPFAK